MFEIFWGSWCFVVCGLLLKLLHIHLSVLWNVNVIVTILINMFSLLIQKRKIFQVTVLGEMDKAESSYEAMCFVTELVEDEFISSDAMSKLRQVKSTLLIIIIIIAFIKITKLVNNNEPFYLPT